jgi:hypothetical protein
MGFQPGPGSLKEFLPLLFLGRDQEFLPPHLHMKPEKITPLGPLYNAGFLRMERQPPFIEKGADHRARLLNGRQAFCHHEDSGGIPGNPVAFPQPFGQSIEIGSKDGALLHCWSTSPPSALRTERATRRCTRLAGHLCT